MNNVVFVSFDGDGIGQKVGQAVLSNDPETLNQVSDSIQEGNALINQWAQKIGATQYSSGGDQGVYSIPEYAIDDLEMIRKDYQFVVGATLTMGVGRDLSESGKALLAGKLRGKNQIVFYDNTVEETLRDAQAHLGNSEATNNEKKIGDAYLNTALEGDMEHKEDCPYCKEMEESESHDCPYCSEYNQTASHEEDCPYCKEMEEESHCEYCDDYDSKENQIEADSGPQTRNPTTTDSEDFAGQDLNVPAIPKPGLNDEPMEVAPDQDETTANNEQMEANNVEPNVHDKEQESKIPVEQSNLEGSNKMVSDEPEDILEAIVQEGSQPNQSDRKKLNENVDDTDLAIGSNMEDNKSRKDDFETEVPGDMGLSEEGTEEDSEPEYMSMVNEDLDNHAENIQKQKIIQSVSEALEGFKASKEILERAKEQAPELYQSCISMLRAMIEMSKMLNLSEVQPSENIEQGSQEVGNPESAMPQEEQVMGDPTNPASKAAKENANPKQ
jgi:hypothetical protein